jgi:hypothetical protein
MAVGDQQISCDNGNMQDKTKSNRRRKSIFASPGGTVHREMASNKDMQMGMHFE